MEGNWTSSQALIRETNLIEDQAWYKCIVSVQLCWCLASREQLDPHRMRRSCRMIGIDMLRALWSSGFARSGTFKSGGDLIKYATTNLRFVACFC